MSGDTPVILVAHNSNNFDHDRLLSFLEKNHERIVRSFPETLFLGDILPTVTKLKTNLDLPSCELSDVYRKFFLRTSLHNDAVADVTALGRIILHSSSASTCSQELKARVNHLVSGLGYTVAFSNRSFFILLRFQIDPLGIAFS